MIKRMFAIFNLIILGLSFVSISVFAEDIRKSYVVGYYQNGYPIQYTNEDSNPAGMSIKILEAIEEFSDLDFIYKPIIEGSSREEIDELDMIISFTNINSHSADIYDKNDRSVPYYELPLFLAGLYEFDFNEVIKVGVFDYIYLEDDRIYELLPNAEIYRYKSIADLEMALIEGEVDFSFTTNLVMQMFLRADIDNEIQSYPVTLSLPMEIIFSDGITEAEQDYINETILNTDSEMINKIILENSYDESLTDDFLKQKELYNNKDMAKNIITTTIIMLIIGGFLIRIYRYHLERITFYDKITDFYTELKFTMEMQKVLDNAQPNEYVLISADIDNFKFINEMYSFSIGTKVLRRFATMLRKIYPKADFICRTHADSFLILIKEKYLQEYDEKEYDIEMQNFIDLLGDAYHIYSSRGLYHIADIGSPLTSIIDCTNFARNVGKDTHGNTLIEFTGRMAYSRESQNRILSNMERALNERGFSVYYQAKIDLKSKKTCGAEALVRWITNSGHTIFPDEFIPLFEKNRYITKLDFYVCEEVCMFISQNRELVGDVVISINLSTITLLLPNIEKTILGILEAYNVPIELVELEITESAFTDNLELVIEQVSKLKKAGFMIALDDFGSGISSLNQLKNIELDVLKIDKAFLSDSLEERKGIVVIENVINLAKDLDLKIVAEGVETLESANVLANLGCDIAQGYYYSRPIPMPDFKEFLKIESFD